MNELTTTNNNQQPAAVSAFSDLNSFELAQRQAKALADSDLVPTIYKGKVANCLVALEVAQRSGASVMAVLQNLNIIHGKPSWSAAYIIASINSCGRFEPLEYRIDGEGDKKTCVAWAKCKKTGNVLEGPAVSIAMAKAEGWYGKTGSKWQTMPDLMLRYRAATFFGRTYVPEVLMGMRDEHETRDIIDVTDDTEVRGSVKAAASVNERIKAAKPKPSVEAAKPAAAPAVQPKAVEPAAVLPAEEARADEGVHF